MRFSFPEQLEQVGYLYSSNVKALVELVFHLTDALLENKTFSQKLSFGS